MKTMATFAMLVFASVAWSGTADAQVYNLRTIPSTPQAGAPFVAAFDNTDCLIWMLLRDVALAGADAVGQPARAAQPISEHP